MTTRREFLRLAATTGAWAGMGASLPVPLAAGETGPTADDTRTLLILGGTAFLGPQLVEAARARGFRITLFNRGRTNPHLFPDLEKLRGDRDGDLKALEGRRWDAVIDTSGYVPRHVADSAGLLKDAVGRYVFVSSISVYAEPIRPGADETAPVGKLAEPTEKVTGETYGPLKALCEQAAEAAMPGRVITVRPGLIVGPGDPTDRFTYWPVRVARGGEVLAPGSPEDPIQFIDVRDLAEWTVRAIEAGHTGTYNATGPRDALGIGRLLASCKTESGSDARFTWIDAAFLEAQGVAPWSDMPVWIPSTGEAGGMSRIKCSRAVGKGLTFRPLGTTVKDTLAWWKQQPADRTKSLRTGLAPAREAEVLAAWKAKASAS